jgi:hypothetical protein
MELTEIFIRRRLVQEMQQDAEEEAQQAAEKPKEQTPEEIFSVLSRFRRA